MSSKGSFSCFVKQTSAEWPTYMVVILTLLAVFLSVVFGTTSNILGNSIGGFFTGVILFSATEYVKIIGLRFSVLAIIATAIIMGSGWIVLDWFIGLLIGAWMVCRKH